MRARKWGGRFGYGVNPLIELLNACSENVGSSRFWTSGRVMTYSSVTFQCFRPAQRSFLVSAEVRHFETKTARVHPIPASTWRMILLAEVSSVFASINSRESLHGLSIKASVKPAKDRVQRFELD
jgi:hypothetical protein